MAWFVVLAIPTGVAEIDSMGAAVLDVLSCNCCGGVSSSFLALLAVSSVTRSIAPSVACNKLFNPGLECSLIRCVLCSLLGK